MLTTLSDPLIVLLLVLVGTQGLASLLGGLLALRRPALSEGDAARFRRELVEWAVLPAKAGALSPDAQAVLRAWARLAARGRVGMGAGSLLAVSLLLALFSLPGSAALPGKSVPTLFALALLLLQAFYLGMVGGQALAWGLGLRRAAPQDPAPTPPGTAALQAPQDPAPAPPGTAALQAPQDPARTGRGAGATSNDLASSPGHRAGVSPALVAPATVPGRPLAAYRSRTLALLPGALLAGDVALVGLADRLTQPSLPPAEVWSLLALPTCMLAACVVGELTMRQIARLPAPALGDDAVLARRADARLRAHLVGLVLELEVFGLFLLVGSQWMLRVVVGPDAGSGLASGVLLVYAVIVLSLRGLLERSQRERAVS